MKRTELTEWGRLLVQMALGTGLLVGCQPNTNDRLNSPPQGSTEKPNPMQEDYVYMADNAMLEDMNMSPAHFVPHRAELNSLGVRRLKRFAGMLDVYGGTLSYDGNDPDKALRKERMDQIKSFLVNNGIAADRFEVKEGIAGGTGMAGQEAVMVRAGSRYKPSAEDSSGSGASAPMNSGSGSAGGGASGGKK